MLHWGGLFKNTLILMIVNEWIHSVTSCFVQCQTKLKWNRTNETFWETIVYWLNGKLLSKHCMVNGYLPHRFFYFRMHHCVRLSLIIPIVHTLSPSRPSSTRKLYKVTSNVPPSKNPNVLSAIYLRTSPWNYVNPRRHILIIRQFCMKSHMHTQ